MAYEQREGSGALFKNDRKSEPTQPDYTGNGLLFGKKVRIAAWIKEGAKGKFMSLSLQEDGGKLEGKPESKPAGRFDDFKDDIPF
jgi:hypothetical protein